MLPTHSDEAPVFGDARPEATAERYLEIGVEEVVVKNGAEPALVATQDGLREYVPAPKAEKVVDATGAGRLVQRRLSHRADRRESPVEAPDAATRWPASSSATRARWWIRRWCGNSR